MRILHVIPAVAPRYGGPSAVALQVCRALEARGHGVALATTDADGPAQLSVPLDTPVRYDDVSAIFFRRTSSEAFKWSPDLVRWLDQSVMAFDLVDIHAIFSHSSLAAGRACRRAGVPYVVRPHGSLDPWSLSRKPMQKRLLFWLGARRLLTAAARVQYTTHEEQRLAETRLPWLTRGAVVSLGIPDVALLEAPARPADPPYVLTMSRLERKKGLELLIDAFHHVTVGSRLAEWRLILAGDGEPAYVQDLKRRAGGGPAAARILFPGWVSGDVKSSLLQGASVFAAPSEQENFGLAIVEAMAAGVPVLVSRGVNLGPEIARTGAGWVIERTSTAFPSVLESVLSDRSNRSTRGRAAWTLAQQYRWDRSTDQLEALYREIVGPHHSGGDVAA